MFTTVKLLWAKSESFTHSITLWYGTLFRFSSEPDWKVCKLRTRDRYFPKFCASHFWNCAFDMKFCVSNFQS
jgi:hypothetical protein